MTDSPRIPRGTAGPSHRLRAWSLVLLTAAILLVGAAGCGKSSGSSGASGGASGSAAHSSGAAGGSGVSHPKVKFVLHAGLAFGAFHHFIYKPARAGDFAHPFSHKLTIIKAGLAAVFVVHEVRLALQDARADPLLSKLVAPITALEARVASLRSDVSSGNLAPIGQADSQISSVESQASSAGAAVREQVPASF